MTNQHNSVQNPNLLIRRQIFQEPEISKILQQNIPTFYVLANWLCRRNLPFLLQNFEKNPKQKTDQFILFDKSAIISENSNINFPEIVTHQSFVNLPLETQKKCLIHETLHPFARSICQKFIVNFEVQNFDWMTELCVLGLQNCLYAEYGLIVPDADNEQIDIINKLWMTLFTKFLQINLKEAQESIRNQISSFLKELKGFPKIDGDLRFNYILPPEILNLSQNSLPEFIKSFFEDLENLEESKISQKYEFENVFLKNYTGNLILKTVKNYNFKEFLY